MGSSPSGSMPPYQPGKRAMLKIKHQRTADCVVAGFRWHKNGPGTHVGSLLLGLFDDGGKLNHVGITSSFSWDRRAALAEELAPLREDAVEGHPWQEWAEWAGCGRRRGLRPAPAGCDVALEPRQGPVLGAAARRARRRGRLRPPPGDRFRHATTFKRWRPDKPPEACRYDQLETTAPFELEAIFGS